MHATINLRSTRSRRSNKLEAANQTLSPRIPYTCTYTQGPAFALPTIPSMHQQHLVYLATIRIPGAASLSLACDLWCKSMPEVIIFSCATSAHRLAPGACYLTNWLLNFILQRILSTLVPVFAVHGTLVASNFSFIPPYAGAEMWLCNILPLIQSISSTLSVSLLVT